MGIDALDRDYNCRHQQNTKGPDAGRASGPKGGRRKTLAHPKSQHPEVSFATRHAAVTNATSPDFLLVRFCALGFYDAANPPMTQPIARTMP
jgi:hypothetical protein